MAKSISAHAPELYTPGIHRTYYTHGKLATWTAEAFLVGILCAFLPGACFGWSKADSGESISLSSPQVAQQPTPPIREWP